MSEVEEKEIKATKEDRRQYLDGVYVPQSLRSPSKRAERREYVDEQLKYNQKRNGEQKIEEQR